MYNYKTAFVSLILSYLVTDNFFVSVTDSLYAVLMCVIKCCLKTYTI